MNNLIIVILSAWLGASLFFTFDVAPVLFKVLPTFMAGEVVSNVFPFYFILGTFLFFGVIILSKINKQSRSFILLSLINLIIFLAFLIYILPLSESLKMTNYQEFLELHGISMSLNLVQIINTTILIIKLME